ncbi:ribonuclease T2 family protein [Caulobacter mirabilis]|uniref:Ribonuclease T n=1 Tax=Caulobacter mirabilis TaxID=69666 RepID=A0A2D2ATM8_9CAUL|nr:ribonuclease T [Caulobacter mirabilis]ATQ41351.1 ribonuclease T [Caulobacter mirabilis]
MRSLSVLLAALLFAGCAQPASPAAEVAACRLPEQVAPAPSYRPRAEEIVRDVPTALYMLALTWAPEICRTRGEDPDNAVQCKTNDFGFVLHGLWPNGAERRHPRYCGPAPKLSAETVREHLCMTPSAEMLQHEWAAHGTCGWDSPDAYFDQAAKLWDGLKRPALTGQTMTAGEIRDAFKAANPWVARDGIYIKAASGNWLEDVRLCYDLQYRPMACRGVGAPDHVVLRLAPRRTP